MFLRVGFGDWALDGFVYHALFYKLINKEDTSAKIPIAVEKAV